MHRIQVGLGDCFFPLDLNEMFVSLNCVFLTGYGLVKVTMCSSLPADQGYNRAKSQLSSSDTYKVKRYNLAFHIVYSSCNATSRLFVFEGKRLCCYWSCRSKLQRQESIISSATKYPLSLTLKKPAIAVVFTSNIFSNA